MRSLLAFWMGGAGAAPGTAGVRSMLAPWMGGAGAETEAAEQAGVRSMLAPWMGGAGAAPSPEETAAVRSMLAFWMGGASAGASVAPPAPDPVGGPGPIRIRLPRTLRDIREQDEMLMLIAWRIAASGLLH